MELVITSHAVDRFVKRVIEAMIRGSYLIPPRTIVKLGIVTLPLEKIKREKYLYAYYSDLNGLFFLKEAGEKLIMKSFVVLQPLLGDHLNKLIQNGNLKRVEDTFLSLKHI